MDYKELVFIINGGEEYQKDLLISALGEIGFDTFEETSDGFKAYIPAESFRESEVKNTLVDFSGIDYRYHINHIAQTNWNEVWESNFEPLIIADKIYVRATFHKPRHEFEHEIVIDPKMAFGTGHHQTTAMVMEFMLEEDFKGKSVLDMGCGTGILAILAQKLGAKKITAIDNDDVCYHSTIENAALNQSGEIMAICGSKEAIPNQQYEVLLANINRNILLDQLDRYAEVLSPAGALYLSGFYEGADLDILKNKCATLGLKYIGHKTSANWAAAKFVH